MADVARILEHSSRDAPEGEADPLMLMYRTGIVHTPDIANVVYAINNARNLAKYMDEKLTPMLLEDVKGFDYAIGSLSSVSGQMLKFLTTQTQNYNVKEFGNGQGGGLSSIITGQQKQGGDYLIGNEYKD